MSIRTAISCGVAVAALIMCIIGYIEYVKDVGFPDGYLTDYDLTMRMTFIIMGLPLLCLSLVVFYLVISGRVKNNATTISKCALAIVMLVILFVGCDLSFYHYVDHGQGG